MVAAEDFREDLMYRINTFEIHLPPLRERIEDVPGLARYLLSRHRRDGQAELAPDAIEALRGHVWPGNVRELANVIEHATILCDSGPIRFEHLPSISIAASCKAQRAIATVRSRCVRWRWRRFTKPWSEPAATNHRPPSNSV